MRQSSGSTVWTDWQPRGRHMPLGTALVLMLASASWAQVPVRERISFNKDWRFAKGDPNGTAGMLSYNNIRDWVLVVHDSCTSGYKRLSLIRASFVRNCQWTPR